MTVSERRKIESIAVATTTSVDDIMRHLKMHPRERAAVKSIVDGKRAVRV